MRLRQDIDFHDKRDLGGVIGQVPLWFYRFQDRTLGIHRSVFQIAKPKHPWGIIQSESAPGFIGPEVVFLINQNGKDLTLENREAQQDKKRTEGDKKEQKKMDEKNLWKGPL